MTAPATHTISSLTEFTQLVEQLLLGSRKKYPSDPLIVNWYRGVGKSSSHRLVPTLYRHLNEKVSNELLKLERVMLERFRRESILHQTVTRFMEPEDPDFELLFFMQHYSVPTRLLDWTMNPYIGLYFAVTSAEFDDKMNEFKEDAAVWVLNPTAWNEQALDHVSWGPRGELSISDLERDGYAPRKDINTVHLAGMYEFPAAMRGIANSTRMFAQKGVFTVFGRNTTPMEELFDTKNYPTESLTKIVIDKKDIAALTDSVLSIGYTDSVSYPDLHGVAMEMRRSYGFKV
jgi:hypothetical protein